MRDEPCVLCGAPQGDDMIGLCNPCASRKENRLDGTHFYFTRILDPDKWEPEAIERQHEADWLRDEPCSEVKH